ncbi:TonB-dependent receptor plug domain-containing protein [Daejeonella sp.]|uniref:TonB-dependent receptor plug domain-containing protein n=1 Tax=Daejeonella sp. TaxID=2805397 RepID=UPI0039830151
MLILPAMLSGQERNTSEADTAGILTEVVITATRRSSALVKSPFSISVLKKKQMNELQYRSTPEALMSVPGVFVQKTNHGGGSAFVRGLTGNQTLILVDGIRLNNSTFRYGPNQYLNTVDHFMIDRVEVVKGSGSVQYGSDAMGGVIQLLTLDPGYSDKPLLHGIITGRYWSNNMEKTGRGQIIYSGRNFAASGGLSTKKFGALVGGDTTGRQTPSGYGEIDADLKLKWKLSDNAELIGAHQFVMQSNVPVYHKVQLENFLLNEMEVQQRTLSYVKLNISSLNQLYKKVSFNGSFQKSDETRNSQKNNSPSMRRELDEIRTSNASVDIVSEFGSNWTSNTGFEYYFDKIDSYKEDINKLTQATVRGRGLYPDNASYANSSIYNLHHFQIRKFNVEAGVRYNWFNATIPDETLGLVNIKPDALVFNAGINYGAGSHYFYTSVSSGYRAPNIDDMGSLGIVDFRYELPSFNLKPERNFNTEVGYKIQSDKIKGSLAIFYNKLSNLITRVKSEGEIINGYNVYRKENIENAYIKGGEGFINWQANEHWMINSFIAYTFGKNSTKDEPLRRMPPLNGNTSFRYTLKRFYILGELAWASGQSRLAQGDRDDNRIPKGGTPGWRVWNTFAGYKYKMLQFRLSLQNIFNEDYRTHGSGINGVGRSVLSELSISL